jgi:nucleotide-binding universal stress UspA family protein
MLPQINKILLPTDLSDNARYALEYAFSMAIALDAGLTVLYVIDDLSASSQEIVKNMVGGRRWEDLKKEKQEKIVDTIWEKVQSLCNEIRSNVPDCPLVVEDIVVKTGHPVEQILRMVNTSGCDMVVMGTRGQGVLSEAVLGSVSQRVVRQSPKPVLTVKPPAD